ncbi:MAG: ABC transporter permease [Puniceicoccales bacterium]|jgi:oligopeptide transport system permease protein|nr:ABC transporter permease [Puniceicoccales bacterium]
MTRIRWQIIWLALLVPTCAVSLCFRTGALYQDIGAVSMGPSLTHPLGTDLLGRDLLLRLLAGGCVSLIVGVIAVTIAMFLAVSIGMLAGYIGNRTDCWLMRLIDVLQALPLTMLILLLMACFGSSLWILCLAIGITEWFTFARVIRARALDLRGQDFVDASIRMGQAHWRVILLHILPNIMPLVRHYALLLTSNAILIEAFLSFLGLGIPPPHSSWGNMIVDGLQVMHTHPMQLFWPSIFLVTTLLAVTSLSESV